MTAPTPVLYLLCGKIAAGKSTLASDLGSRPGTIVLSEDAWLGALFGDRMKTGADYLLYSAKLKEVLGPHIADLLKAGLSVVLDFAANTVAQRQWMRQVVEATGVDHELHFLDVPDEVCLERLRARNAAGEHEFAATEEQFRRFAAHFVAPSEDEGFTIVRH